MPILKEFHLFLRQLWGFCWDTPKLCKNQGISNILNFSAFDYYMNQLSSQWWWVCQIALFSKPSGFCNYQYNFQFLLQFYFVWLTCYTFSCVISLIYWFLNRFFMKHQLIKILGNQRFGKILLSELISKLLIFAITKFHIANQCL